jgi:hypothetical protein
MRPRCFTSGYGLFGLGFVMPGKVALIRLGMVWLLSCLLSSSCHNYLFTSYTGKVSLASKFFFPPQFALHAYRTKTYTRWVLFDPHYRTCRTTPRARIRKSNLPGWASIPGLPERFTNTDSVLLFAYRTDCLNAYITFSTILLKS